ncbi:MAG: HD family phosphohydrolase [bacterium]
MQAHKFWRYTPQILMGVAIIVSTTFMFPYEQSYRFAHLNEGDVYIGDEIIAPFTFHIMKSEEEYNRDKQLAAQKVPLVFAREDSIEQKSLTELENFFKSIDAIRESVSPDSIKVRRLSDFLNNASIIIEQNYIPLLLNSAQKSQPSRSSKKKVADKKNVASADETELNYDLLKSDLKRIVIDTYSIGILNLPFEETQTPAVKISLKTQKQEIVEDINNFYRVDNIENVLLEDKLRQIYQDNETAVKIGYAIITAFIRPNLIYQQAETESRIDEAIARVAIAKGTVLAKERIVDTHERITKEIIEKLNSLALARSEKESQEGGWRLIIPYLGRALIVTLSLSFTIIFLMVSRRQLFENVKTMLMIFIIMMIIIIFTFLITQLGFTKYKYLIPISIAAMLLMIFFDTRTAFIGTVTLSLLIGALRGNEFGIMLTSLFVGTISIFSVREIQARSWILKGILFITAAYMIAVASVEFLRNPESINRSDLIYATMNGTLSPILTYGLMIIFEYIFQMTTNSTLLELSDLNKPLLRQLAIRAPGTNHHSIMVGNLSEAAAEAIGANALLARVASYYHDIGKMEMPEYFVENQKGGKNPHEKLTPNMSCLILINHVKRGLEIAEEYNLPKEIRDFIPQHHGTNLIKYFYNKALETSDDNEVNESDFRYPGPKPQTKETGIVMLADAVEAGSRTLKEPTVSRIRNLVNSFIQERLIDSELDECPLTMKDLNLVKESFVNNLTGVFHGRIEYPEQNNKLFRKKVKGPTEKASENSN